MYVGDSRAVLCREDGEAYPLSYDHKPSHVVEKNRIEKVCVVLVPYVLVCVFLCRLETYYNMLFKYASVMAIHRMWTRTCHLCNKLLLTDVFVCVKAGGYINQVGRINGNLNLSRSLGDLKV